MASSEAESGGGPNSPGNQASGAHTSVPASMSDSKEVRRRLWQEVMKPLWPRFCETVDPADIIDVLFAHGQITSATREECTMKNTLSRDRAGMLLSALEKMGSQKAFIILVQALDRHAGPNRQLAQEIIPKAENEVSGIFQNTLGLLSPETTSACFPTERPTGSQSGRNFSRSHHVHMQRDEWEEAVPRFLGLWKKTVDAMEIADAVFEDGIITMRMLEELRKETRELIDSEKAYALLLKLQKGGSHSYERTVNILWTKGTESYRNLATKMNEEANVSMPGRNRQLEHDSQPGEQLKPDEVEWQEPKLAMDTWVIFHMKDKLCELDDLLALFRDFDFSAEENADELKRLLRDTKKPTDKAKKQFLSALLKVEKLDLKRVAKQLKQSNQRKHVEEMQELMRERRKKLESDWMVQRIYTTQQPSMSLEDATKVHYLQERPSIVCNDEARDFIRNQLSFDKSVPTPPPQQRPRDDKFSNLPCVRRDIGKHFTSERWSDNRMVVKTVAVIGSREAVQSYCRKQFKRKLTPLQLSEIWPGQRGTEGNACSTMHAIIHRSEGDNPCECYFILDLHPMDREETHCQMLHKVLNAAQSVLLLYQTHEVDADWLLANQPQSKPSLQLMTSSGLPNDNGTYTILQRAMLDRIREVFKLFPVCPIYHSVKVPATYLRIAVVANVQLANLEKRLVHANHVFEMARSKEVRQLDEKLMWEEQYHRSSQLPFVSIDSTPEMASSNPAKWCQQTQYPVCQWLDDLTTPSPVTLLAAVDRDTPLCTAFPACADEIYDETTEDDVGILFAKIQEMNLLQPSLSAREVPICVVTCLADDRRDAFMCLNMFAGAAFPVAEVFDLKLEANGEASASSDQALCRLIGCARFVNGQVFVLLTFIGLTPTSLQEISPAQKVILLSAIALSHLFVVDTKKPRTAAKALGKFIQGTLGDDRIPIATRDGSTLSRENVDRQLFHGLLLVISPLAKSSKPNQPADKQQPTAAASRRSLAVERQQSKEIDKSYFTQLCLLFDHVSFGEYEAAPDWPNPVIPNFQRQCAQCSRNVTSPVPTRSEMPGCPQAQTVAEAYQSLPDLGHFPDGKAFLARLNLLLALASRGFQSPFKLNEMFRHSTEQVRDDLHNVIVFGQAEGEPTTETYSYPHLKKSMDVEVVLDTADPVSLVQKIRLQIRTVFGGSKNRNFVRAEVQRVVKSFVQTRCKVGEEFLLDQERRFEDRAEYISTLHEDILEFRNKWTLCGKPCSKCHMWCLLPSNHGNDHNCGSDSQGHECGIECQQLCLSENDGPPSNCNNTCTALAGHEEENEEEHGLVPDERVHRCEPFENPNIHMCRKECNLLGPQKCSKECQKYVGNHPDNQHDCGEPHSCPFPCEAAGRCIAQGGSLDESLAPNVEANIGKRPCKATLGKGETPDGSGKHLHECDSGKHYCDFKCKFCGKFCQLDADHLQLSPASLHQIEHGLIISKRDLHVYDAYGKLVDIPPEATCETICSKTAGTGHSHFLGYCTAGAACTENSKSVRHIFLGSTLAHFAKHPEFWNREKVEEPCPGHVDDFLQCGIYCGGCDDGDQRPLCSEKMWHESCRRSPGSFLMPYPKARKVGQQTTFHKFTSHMHPCLEKCKASESCAEECECAFGHTCSAACPDDCPGEGDSLGKHVHSSPALHHCGRSHRCSEVCKHPGTCFLHQTMSAEPPEGSVRVSSVGNAYRLLCSTNFPKGYSNHKHLDKSHSCGKPHTCEKYCRLCQKYCKLPYNHSGVCDTDHGAIVDTELPGLVIRRQNDSRVELTAGLTCANLCQAAGPSHKHETSCECAARVGWGVTDFYNHRSAGWFKSSVYEVSHRTLWEKIMGFKDPHPDAADSKGFSRCPQQCPGKEHSKDADRPYCDAGLFHPKLDPANYSHIKGYVSQEKHPHHYPCTNHKCQGPCPKMDNGKPCEETCKWDADHTSRGERNCVCWKEEHRCGVECENLDCTQLCQKEWKTVHRPHQCDETLCGASCQIVGNCESTCVKNHIHDGTCSCGRIHPCDKPCQKPGICNMADAAGSLHQKPTPQNCDQTIRADTSTHFRGHDCGKDHRCDHQCPFCEQYCTKKYGHDGADKDHTTIHSAVMEGTDMSILDCEGQAITIATGTSCSEICKNAGPGHSHCVEATLNQHLRNNHTLYRAVPGSTRNIPHTTHANFWSRLQFEDPTDDQTRDQLNRCHVCCDQHGDSSRKVFCTGKQWHQEFDFSVLRSKKGYVGNVTGSACAGHHFECLEHTCGQLCDLYSPSGKCSQTCGLPLGHSCTESCSDNCNGSASETHRPGMSKHCCKSTHQCCEYCNVSEGHCKPVEEPNCSTIVRLKCKVEIPAGKYQHPGKQHRHYKQHSAAGAHDKMHFCKVRCPTCLMTCQKAFPHKDPHQVEHGKAFGVDELKQLNVGHWTVQTRTGGEPVLPPNATCTDVCHTAGPGHLHSQACAGINSCMYKQYARHANGSSLHYVSHSNFCEIVNFEDQFSKDDFSECSLPCSHSDHDHAAKPSLCRRPLFHPRDKLQAPGGHRRDPKSCWMKCAHDCEKPCRFERSSKNCQSKCKHPYEHDDQVPCVCKETSHLCNGFCVTCDQPCVVTLEDTGAAEHKHLCEEPKQCEERCPTLVDSAGKVCGKSCTKDHLHENPPTHNCNGDHPCLLDCQMSGRCPHQLGHTVSDVVKGLCFLKMGHSGGHCCSQQAHLCTVRCQLCQVPCWKTVPHIGEHQVQHSLVKAGTEVMQHSERRLVEKDLECGAFCELAGRGHLHIVPYDPNRTEGLQEGKEQNKDGIHTKTHKVFWQSQNIADPTWAIPSETRAEFDKCSHFCHEAEPTSYCNLPVLHRSEAAPNRTHLKDGHYYPDCMSLCSQKCATHPVYDCQRPCGHKGKHVCDLDDRESRQPPATTAKPGRCSTFCPLCDTRCSLGVRHEPTPHDCTHGPVKEVFQDRKMLYRRSAGVLYGENLTVVDLKGKTCLSMCQGLDLTHSHVYNHCGNGRVSYANCSNEPGVSHNRHVKADICMHTVYWRLHGFSNPTLDRRNPQTSL